MLQILCNLLRTMWRNLSLIAVVQGLTKWATGLVSKLCSKRSEKMHVSVLYEVKLIQGSSVFNLTNLIAQSQFRNDRTYILETLRAYRFLHTCINDG